MYVPAARVVHALSQSSTQLPAERTIRYRLDSLLLYLQKHYRARYERLYRSLMRRAWRGVVAHGAGRHLPGRAGAHHHERWAMYRVWCERFFGHRSALRAAPQVLFGGIPQAQAATQSSPCVEPAEAEPPPERDT